MKATANRLLDPIKMDPYPSSEKIPDKLYFKIGEVSAITELPPYVLRFWETEFAGIRPKRSGTGQRLYQKREIELILQIKHLLHNEKFTLKGAKRYLRQQKKTKPVEIRSSDLDQIRAELRVIRDLLQ